MRGATMVMMALGLLAAAPGCNEGKGCRVDPECGSGMVCATGTCVPSGDVDLSVPVETDGSVKPDMAQPPPPDGFSPDAIFTGCPANMDGVIQRAEIPAMPGVGSFFHMNGSGQTSTVNQVKQNGAWDFTTVAASDEKVYDGLLSPVGTWWSSSFPDATYAQLMDAQNDFLGVYQIQDSGLYLLGVVSRSDGFTATNISYAMPIKVLSFPMAMGDQWSTESSVSGVASGVSFYATETWAVHIDDSGIAKTPFADFKVLRLRLDYQQVWGFNVTTHIIYLYITECYGTVVRVRSADGETAANFTEATEYRRLAAP